MIRGQELWIILVFLTPVVLALVDVLRTDPNLWLASGQSQLVWVIVVLLAPILGPLLYLLVARPRLNAQR